MCKVVTLDLRRLITVIRTAMIPTPSAIVNQKAIVYPSLEFDHPRGLGTARPGRPRRRGSRSIQNPHAAEKGKDWAGRGAGREGAISLELLGIARGVTRQAPLRNRG
jgi:hypothetical protein